MKLLVVGLDGLSWNMLSRFDVNAGYFRDVYESGASTELWSVDSPTTLPAWTSFATGKDAGSHGIYGMKRQSANYETGPTDHNTTDAAIYDLLDDAILINLPGSERRLATSEDSYVVSSFASKDKYDAVPDDLRSLDTFDEYRSSYDSEKKKKQGAYVDHICDISDRRYEFASEAFREFDPRVGFVLFSATDWIGHFLTNTDDEETRADWYRRVVERCIAHAASLAEDTDAENVVLMSDHGFEYKKKTLHLNEWFEDEDYIDTAESDASPLERGIVLTAKAIAKRSDGAYELIRRGYNRIIGTNAVSGVREAARTNISYEDSTAWEVRYGNVFVNDERFVSPTVDDPEELRSELQQRLRQLRDEDGERVFRDVLLREEVYQSPIHDLLPDVVARPASGYHPTLFNSPTGGYTSPTDNFDHRYRGVFAGIGPAFEESTTVEDMSIIDVLPTLLHALDQMVPNDLDGTVEKNILTTDRNVEFFDSSDVEPQVKSVDSERTDAAEERLKDLGYLD